MPLLLAISTISAAVIGYEILLMRLLSIVQWHHFAYMVISLALLGYGASGTLITLTRTWMLRRFVAVFATAAALFGSTAVGAFALAQRLPFNPLELVWDPLQPLYLLQVYLLLAVPFFCGASCVGLAFCRLAGRIDVVYRYDLLGAGGGALGIVLLMFALPPEDALRVIGGLGFAAAALVCLSASRGRWPAAGLAVVGIAGALLWPQGALAPRLSPYKELSQVLELPGARVIAARSSPLGAIAVVESPAAPLRHAPGLSLMARGTIPPQLGVFSDGGGMTAITRDDPDRDRLDYLDWQLDALPYHLLDRPRVLILGAGGGADVLRARHHGARRIDAVELNPQIVDLVKREYAAFAGRLYDRQEVRVHVAEARGFVARGAETYDLITLALLDSFAASSAGLYALSESTLYTVEAMATYLGRLSPGGLLAITRWLKLPPRDTVKLFATAAAALERRGVTRPGERLALVRSWNTATLLVKNGALTGHETEAIKAFAADRGFDLAYLPGLGATEVNRFNVLRRPYLYEAATALLGEGRDAFLDAYKFHVAPATDDRPYFFRFFSWRALPDLIALRETGSVQLVEWGYLILVATLVQAALASVVIILLPLGVVRRRGRERATGEPIGRVVIYFTALGLAFLFVEIAFIQRFTLFLSHPLYAIAVVLSAFLVFAGLGSGVSERLAARWRSGAGPTARRSPIALAVAAILGFAGVYLVALPPLFGWLLPLPTPAKVVIAIALIAPLAFTMGMPFPLGLRRLSDRAPRLVPWAWSINGCASVLSAVLATLLAIHFGFTWVVLAAMALYAIAAAAFAGAFARTTEPIRAS